MKMAAVGFSLGVLLTALLVPLLVRRVLPDTSSTRAAEEAVETLRISTPVPVPPIGSSAPEPPPVVLPPKKVDASPPNADRRELPEPPKAEMPVFPTEPVKPLVRIEGDASRVELRAGDRSFDTADAPPGDYVVLAWFGGKQPFKAGTLQLSSGDRVTLRCVSQMLKCTSKHH
jgi:hypothetical protein